MIDLAQLERQKAEIFAEIQAFPPELQTFQPRPEQWSAAQVLDHLARTEAAILATAELSLPKPHRIGLRDRIGVVFIERVFRSDRRVKVPASASRVLPVSSPDLPSVLASWNETRQRLHRFTTATTADQSTGGLFRHPIGGWMNLSQILTFFSVHILHHHHQLTRLRASFAVSAPPPTRLP